MAFWNECKQFISKHGEDTVVKFYCYWAEEVKGTGMMLWELETKWTLWLRIKGWAKKPFEIETETTRLHQERETKKMAKQAANTAEQQASAAKREQDNAKLEQEIEERKAGAVSYEEYRQMKSTQKEPSLMCRKTFCTYLDCHKDELHALGMRPRKRLPPVVVKWLVHNYGINIDEK